MSSAGENTNFNPMEYFSWTNKSKNNFKYCESSADYIDQMISKEDQLDYEAKLFINYGIVNGRDMSKDETLIKRYGEQRMKDFGVTAGHPKIQYVPAADTAIKFLHGQAIRRPFNPTFRDLGNITMNEYRETYQKLIDQYFHESMYLPLKQQAQFMWQQEYGIEDVLQLTPDQQTQMNNEVEARVQQMLPEEINDHMRFKFKSSVEKDGQVFMDILINKFDIETKANNNIVNLIASGKEVFFNGIRNNKVVFEPVNPFGFYALMNDEDILVENAKIIRRERLIPFIEIFTNHGNHIKGQKLYNEILKLSTASTGRDWNSLEFLGKSGVYGGEVVEEVTMQDGIQVKDTVEKQGYDSRLLESVNFNKKIREQHYVWVSLRKIKVVYRKVDGELVRFKVADNYVMNKSKKDVKVDTIMGHELMQTYKLGAGSNVFHLSKGPVPFQYHDPDDPYSVKMPYSGVDFNLTMGNAETTAPVDYAKAAMSKICLINYKLDKAELQDKGKILGLAEDALPEKMKDPGDFAKTADEHGVVVMNTEGLTIEGGERKRKIGDVISVFDTTNNQDETVKMNKMDHYENKILYQIGADPRLVKMSERYIAKDVRENTQIQSSYISEGLFSFHNKAVESALKSFVMNGIANIKEEGKISMFVYNQYGRQLRNIDIGNLKDAMPMIDLNMTSKDIELLDASKKLIMEYIAYAKIEYKFALKLLWAKTRSEILEIAEESHALAMEQIQAERDHANKQLKLQLDAAEASRLADRAHDIKLKEMDGKRSVEYAEINATTLERQFDIDKDGRNDLERVKEKQIAADEVKDIREHKEKMRKLDLEEKELSLKYGGISKSLNK